MEQPDYTVGEGDGEVSVCAVLEEGELDGVSVDLQIMIAPGSALESSEAHYKMTAEIATSGQ